MNYIKDNLHSGVVETSSIKSVNQLADIMIHVVASDTFHSSLSKLGMCYINAPP